MSSKEIITTVCQSKDTNLQAVCLRYPEFYKIHLPSVDNGPQDNDIYNRTIFYFNEPNTVVQLLKELEGHSVQLLKDFMRQIIMSDYLPLECYNIAIAFVIKYQWIRLNDWYSILDWIAMHQGHPINKLLNLINNTKSQKEEDIHSAYFLIHALLTNPKHSEHKGISSIHRSTNARKNK